MPHVASAPGSMKLLSRITRPLTRTVRTDVRVDTQDSLGHGLDAVLTLVLFLLVGFGLDSWFGTIPVFMIVMTVLAAIGLFAKFKYRYDERMDELEAERLAKLGGAGAAAGADQEAA